MIDAKFIDEDLLCINILRVYLILTFFELYSGTGCTESAQETKFTISCWEIRDSLENTKAKVSLTPVFIRTESNLSFLFHDSTENYLKKGFIEGSLKNSSKARAFIT